MAFSILVHRVPEGITNPMREMGSWPLERFPSMGDAAQTVAQVNAAFQARGILTNGVDRTSGLNLPHGVAALTAAFADGQLRYLRAENPSQDLMQLLVDVGGQDQWRIFDAKSGDALVTLPPQPIDAPTPATRGYLPPQTPAPHAPAPQPPIQKPPAADPAAGALAQLAHAVRAVHTAGTQAANVFLRGVGDYIEGDVELLPSQTRLPLTGDIRLAGDNLRRAMYQPELGTWHQAEVRVPENGEPSITTDHQTEPSWSMVPPARQFTRDLQRFPRATQHVPAWYIRPSEEVAQIDPGGMFTLAGTEENALRRRVPDTNLLIPVHHREQVGPNGRQQQLIFEIYLPQDCWRQGTRSPLAQWVDQQLVATGLWQSETRPPDAELIWRVAEDAGANYLNELLARHGITGITVQARIQNGAAA